MEIKAIEYYLPKNVVSNELLAKEFPEWDAEKIADKIGIKQRHVVAKDETALDLAFYASKKVLKKFDRAVAMRSRGYIFPSFRRSFRSSVVKSTLTI